MPASCDYLWKHSRLSGRCDLNSAEAPYVRVRQFFPNFCIHASFLSCFLSAPNGLKNVLSESVQKRTHPMSMPTRHILGLASNEAVSLVFDPTDARQINLPSFFVNLEALRKAKGVRCHELLVFLREERQTFEELLERAHQILGEPGSVFPSTRD